MKKIFTLRNMLLMAMLIAISIILSRFLGFYLDPNSLRISFESIPILLAGIWLGPIPGMFVGCVADILGSLISGVAFTPFLTIGPVMTGLLSGIIHKYILKKNNVLSLSISCILAEFTASMIITTFILMKLYGGTYLSLFITRLPFKLITITINTIAVNSLNSLLYNNVVIKYLKK